MIYILKYNFCGSKYKVEHDEEWHEWVMPIIKKNKSYKIISITTRLRFDDEEIILPPG